MQIIKFPKKEVIVTLSSKIVLAKMDFCGTGIAKKGDDRHTRFGWNYGLAGIMIIFINRIDPDSIRIRSDSNSNLELCANSGGNYKIF